MTQLSSVLTVQPLLIVLALFLTALLIIAMGAVAWSFDLRRARLPLATQWDDLDQKVDALRGEYASKKGELEEINRRIQERDHIGAEVAVLREQLDALRLELSGLDEGQRQIEEIKRKAAEAAAEYADIAGKRDEASRELAEAKERRAQLNAVGDDMTRLQAELEALRVERATLVSELATMREERAKVRTDLEVARDLIARSDALRHEIDRLQRQKEQTEAAATDADRRCTEVRKTLDELQPSVVEARQLAGSLPEMEARRAALDVKIKELEDQAKRLGTTPTDIGDTPLDPLADLKIEPTCLSGLPGTEREAQTEADAVEDVCKRLKDLGLLYSRRVVRAFHTALKINDTAQITVLAGVSGTGKSLLPRRYAEAMGIAFLQIAVEPRWDSPQDLLGFYNYVEQRYRATELARTLVRMDPFNTSGLAETALGERMLLVLLDEMNLARVEYYFSEFLSRLEVRPPYAETADPAKRRDASMPIDISGRKDGPVYLFPSHNVLFVGTMNDDESTQALSDKVLDRGNVMQFPAPRDFAPATDAGAPPPLAGYRRFRSWRNWVKPVGSLSSGERQWTEKVISDLARIMEDFGRPFGHRLNEAILAYIANYPRQPAETLNEPLADQIEYRILPKLRGVPIEESRTEFDALTKLIREDLHDGAFADQLAKLVELQTGRSSQFSWRGLDRG